MPNQRRQEKVGQSKNLERIKADLVTSQLFSFTKYFNSFLLLNLSQVQEYGRSGRA